MGLEVFVALIANGVAVGTALTATYGVFGAFAIRLIGGVLLNAAATAAFSKGTGSQQDTRRRIAQQKELPFKRAVYGRCFATGTPSQGVAIGGFFYVPYLLNSRPSEGNLEIYLDNRAIVSTGNAYDFTGTGATATNGNFAGHVSYWIQLGDKTGPPASFVSEAAYNATTNPLGFKSTDAGQGCTIVWLKLKRGDDGSFQNRWPSYPYVNLSVLGDWSLLYDPREVSHTAADTATHAFSRNQALVGLDLAMRNPFRPHPEAAVDVAMWSAAADAADQTVALDSGGSEPRYRCDGTVLFDGSELEQLMAPILQSGASSLVRSGGRLGIVPGVAKNIALTVEEMVGLPSVSTVKAPETQYDEVHVTYAPLDRDGEPASLKPWSIPGVVGSGLPRVLSLDFGMVGSGTQAMRLRKIAGLKATYMRTLEGTAWPEMIKAVAGSWVTINLGYTKLDGTFEVTSLAPMTSPSGDEGGIAYRVPVALSETSAAVYAWDEVTDEEAVATYAFIYDEDGVLPPGAISITTGDTVNLNTGGTIIPRVRFAFTPSTSANISAYQWQFAEQGEPYTDTFTIDADADDGAGNVFGFLQGTAGQAYDMRARAVSAAGFSDWVGFTGATPVVNIALSVPTINSATGGLGKIDVDVTAPSSAGVKSIEILQSATDDSGAAVVFFEAAATANQNFQAPLTGLGSAETKYIFARVRGDFASASSFTASTSATSNTI